MIWVSHGVRLCEGGGHWKKKSRSRVTDSSAAGTRRETVKVVSCGRLFHGRWGTTPVIVNVRNDCRSPSKSVLIRIGGGCEVI